MKTPALFIGAVYCLAAVAADASPYESNGVVPDVIDATPKDTIQVTFANNVTANFGNSLTPTQVKDQPKLSWPVEAGALYTLFMVDPDALSRKNPTIAQYLHFMVGNIKNNDVAEGTIVAAYVGSQPPKDTGYHRYVILAYKQPGHIDYEVTTNANPNRTKFSVKKYAAKHNLGLPVAGNFFQAQFEETSNSAGSNILSYLSIPVSIVLRYLA